MLTVAQVLLAALAYLALLFGVAWWADRRARQQRSVIGNPWVYTLSLGVYCTAWTYFGSVGRAASGGIWFLPVYLGPTLAMVLAWLVLRKMVRIAQAQRITSIADFVASRYGKSHVLGGLVSLICVVGIVPYIALQLKAVAVGFSVLTHVPGEVVVGGAPDTALLAALALAAFTVLFGTRHLDAAERHEGMVAAVALESVVKLLAFIAVGVFVVWGLFDGPAALFAQAQAKPALAPLLRLSQGMAFPHAQWLALTLLSGLSLLLLPRQFQVMVVECVDEQHIRRAAWAFPAYLLLINLFVLPIALGGLLYFGAGGAGAAAAGAGVNPDAFVLALPLAGGQPVLALVAFIGGLSAATGMVIVETIAVSTMVCNDLVMPLLLRWGALARRRELAGVVLAIRRAAIVVVLLLGWAYYRLAGDAYALVGIGLISFAAVAQFAPALLGGLFWRGGTRAGALAGLGVGFGLWVYTLMLPSVAKSGWWRTGFVSEGPWGIGLLRPEHLLGLQGLDSLTHGLFWSLLLNVVLYVGVSLARPPAGQELRQALLFVDVFKRPAGARPVFWRGQAKRADLLGLATRFLGPVRAGQLLGEPGLKPGAAALPAGGAAVATAAPGGAAVADAELVQRVESALAGAIGAASARAMVASVVDEEPPPLSEVLRILDEASELRAHARALEQQQRALQQATSALRAANERLEGLDRLKDDFMASVTHELRTPLTAIRAFTELMRDEPQMPDGQRQQFLGIVVKETERLSRLVNQVLDLAKIESGHAEWHNSPVDLVALVQQAAQAVQPLMAERGATLTLDLPAAVPPLQADPDRLQQVLVNLLSNAAKFVPKPGGQVRVQLRADGAGVTVTVSDNGPGVPEALRDQVFERFRQGHTTGPAGASGATGAGVGAGQGAAPAAPPQGTGLGLSISRRIVAHFGGQLVLLPAAPPGTPADLAQGASFQFRLPWSADLAVPQAVMRQRSQASDRPDSPLEQPPGDTA